MSKSFNDIVQEMYEDLRTGGYPLSMEQCLEAERIFLSDSKRACIAYLESQGVVFTKSEQKFNNASCTFWYVNKIMMFTEY